MKFYMLALPDFYSLLLVYLSSGPSMPFLHILPEIIGIVPGAYLFKIYIFTYFLLLWCTLITRAQWLQWVGLVPPRHVGLWFPVSWPGIEPASPALESELSTTGPQGKSPWCVSYSHTRALSALGWERNWFLFVLFPTEPSTQSFLCACCTIFDERMKWFTTSGCPWKERRKTKSHLTSANWS